MSQTRAGSQSFVALDFETANSYRNSACSVAVVRVEQGKIVDRVHRLIRPPSTRFEFTYIHKITWAMVAQEPGFKNVWVDILPLLNGAEYIAAHNASFDSSVLKACCAEAGVPMPSQPFKCTVDLARKQWGIHPTKLPDVCRHLKIGLQHHDALSDAEACAQIVLAATSMN